MCLIRIRAKHCRAVALQEQVWTPLFDTFEVFRILYKTTKQDMKAQSYREESEFTYKFASTHWHFSWAVAEEIVNLWYSLLLNLTSVHHFFHRVTGLDWEYYVENEVTQVSFLMLSDCLNSNVTSVPIEADWPFIVNSVKCVHLFLSDHMMLLIGYQIPSVGCVILLFL